MLCCADEILFRPARVAIAGVAGAGKSTAAGRIASVIHARHTDLDGLYHGPKWVPRPSFLDDVTQLTNAASWVTEWQYRDARELITCDPRVELRGSSPPQTSRRRGSLRSRGVSRSIGIGATADVENDDKAALRSIRYRTR